MRNTILGIFCLTPITTLLAILCARQPSIFQPALILLLVSAVALVVMLLAAIGIVLLFSPDSLIGRFFNRS